MFPMSDAMINACQRGKCKSCRALNYSSEVLGQTVKMTRFPCLLYKQQITISLFYNLCFLFHLCSVIVCNFLSGYTFILMNFGYNLAHVISIGIADCL